MIPLVGYLEHFADFPPEGPRNTPDSPALRRELCALFAARSAAPLGRGFHNAHHRLTTGPYEPDIVARRALVTDPVFERRLEREHRLLGDLSEVGFDHAPRPVRYVPSGPGGAPLLATEHVEGPTIGTAADDAAALGQVVGRLHELPVPRWLADYAPTTDPRAIVLTICRNWQRFFPIVQNGLAPEPRHQARRLVDELPKHVRALDWSDARTVMVHGDLGPHNARRTPDGLVLLDWEHGAATDPTLDLMWLWVSEGFGREARAAFLHGYAAATRRHVPNTWPRRLAVLCSVGLVQLALWAQSGLDDIAAGHADAFVVGQRGALERQVARLPEAAAWIDRAAGHPDDRMG